MLPLAFPRFPVALRFAALRLRLRLAVAPGAASTSGVAAARGAAVTAAIAHAARGDTLLEFLKIQVQVFHVISPIDLVWSVTKLPVHVGGPEKTPRA